MSLNNKVKIQSLNQSNASKLYTKSFNSIYPCTFPATLAMSERKVLNKYISPDFDNQKPNNGSDPTNRTKRRSPTVRLMAPFSMQCLTCCELIYKGKKFNARKERTGEAYLGKIEIFRFYIRCPRCAQEITFKTDPEHTDYAVEGGAKRNWEPWKQEMNEKKQLEQDRQKEEQLDALKALENKGLDTKRELEVFEALDGIRALNARNAELEPRILWKPQESRTEKMGLDLGLDQDHLKIITGLFSNPTSTGLLEGCSRRGAFIRKSS